VLQITIAYFTQIKKNVTNTRKRIVILSNYPY
jgi:hypothetical protein